MQKLEKLSSNIPKILNEFINNQNLCKYLYYPESNNPLLESNLTLPAKSLLFNKIYPFPFIPNLTDQIGIYLLLYYGRVKYNNKYVEDHNLFFDIIISKDKAVWKMDGGKLKPYQLLIEIMNTLFDKDLDLGGKIIFTDSPPPFPINEKYIVLRTVGNIINVSTGKK